MHRTVSSASPVSQVFALALALALVVVLPFALSACGSDEPASDGAASDAPMAQDAGESASEAGGETDADAAEEPADEAQDAQADEEASGADGATEEETTSSEEAGLGLFADAPSASRAAYDAVETGMSYEEVVAALGSEGSEMMRMEMMGTESAAYVWTLDGAEGDLVLLTFMDGSLLSKAIQGAAALRAMQASESSLPADVGGAVTRAQYEQLETGMSYQDAVAILGSEGAETYEAAIADAGATAYTWRGAAGPHAMLTLIFQDDALTSKLQVGLE